MKIQKKFSKQMTMAFIPGIVVVIGLLLASGVYAAVILDKIPPAAPTALAGSANSSAKVTLTWAAAIDNVGVTAYQVYRNGLLVGTVATPGYVDTGLTQKSVYSYSVRAADAAGNISIPSNTITVQTPVAIVDNTAPTAPTALKGYVNSSTKITLAWTAATDNVGVDKYQVFRNSVLVGTSATPGYVDTGVTQRNHYTYSVKAVDAAGNVSPASNVIDMQTISTTSPGPEVFVQSQQVVTAVNGTTGSASIYWNTSPYNTASSSVAYGTAMNALNSKVAGSNNVSEQTVQLTGLSRNTTYYYQVTVTFQVPPPAPPAGVNVPPMVAPSISMPGPIMSFKVN